MGDELSLTGPVRDLHTQGRARPARGLRRRRGRDGARPVDPAASERDGEHAPGPVLLRCPHRGRPVLPRRDRRNWKGSDGFRVRGVPFGVDGRRATRLGDGRGGQRDRRRRPPRGRHRQNRDLPVRPAADGGRRPGPARNPCGAQGSDLLRQVHQPHLRLIPSAKRFAAQRETGRIAMSAPAKQRSFPKIEFTDSEAGALEFPSSKSRKFNYYKPAKLRSTMYEDVTVDVQPDPERHLTQGWIYGFGDGPGGYPQDWTVAKSSNWHAFLDPNEEWEQTIYRNNAAVVRQVDLCLRNAKRARAYEGWNTSWLKFLERHLGAWMHAENGMALHVFTSIQRSGPDEHDQQRGRRQRRPQVALRPGPGAVQPRSVRGRPRVSTARRTGRPGGQRRSGSRPARSSSA